jgi:hypothetical protein
VRFVSLLHEQNSNGECRALINIAVSMFSRKEDGSLGKRLAGPGFNEYQVELVADNMSLVDLTPENFGGILLIRQAFSTVAEWEKALSEVTVQAMYQGDFFELLREQFPIRIGDMIRLHITQADQMGRFK